jgi:outer membrane protein assembly factor BamE (lipoprotein component of BamABCDE complex)
MKSITSLLITILVLGLTGCASTSQQSKFTATTVEQIKAGMTKDEVTTILGEPRSRMADNDGGEIWQYRKNALEGKAVKIMANITSFGLDTAVDAEYQDILTVTFQTNVVLKATYEENVHNLTPLAGHN